MKIKDAEWQTCECCGNRKRLSEDEYGCDTCGQPNGEHDLQLTVFKNKRGETQYNELRFCSWKCCLEKLPSLTTDYFINLPMLHFDDETPEPQRASAFFREIELQR